tara:strand:+ start:259 stop:519 length:261 start_codon:yes stop_codon:yes gene_type:complete
MSDTHHIDASRFAEVISVLADWVMYEKLGKNKYYGKVWKARDNQYFASYNEEGQEMFNEYTGIIKKKLRDMCNIVPKEMEDDTNNN